MQPITVANHRVAGAPYRASPNVSGALFPTAIMLHYTAGWSAQSAVGWLTMEAAQASAHVVIDNDGTITQLVDFSRRAWHAGTANKGDMLYPNAEAIGIEMVNPGFWRVDNTSPTGFCSPDRLPDGSYAPVPAGVVAAYKFGPVTANPVYGNAPIVWVDCLPKQIEATKALVTALCAAYPAINRLMLHSDARSDKSDFLSPRFPRAEFEALIPKGRPALPPAVVHVAPPSAPGELRIGMPQSEEVRALQRELVKAGFLPDPRRDAADGWFGAGTERAVRAMQSANGVQPDGIVGAEERALLGLA